MDWGPLLLLAVGIALPTGPEDEGPAPSPEAGRPERHEAMVALSFGEGPRSYWLFEPSEPRPEGPAPVVVFCHGWMSTNPGLYGAWIAHLTRRGHVVIYPRYQDDWSTPPADFLPNALEAVRDALVVLETAPGHVRPDRSRFVLVGHSAGGNLAAQLAALASELGLPEPKALACILPGEVLPAAGPDFGLIPSTTALVVAACEEDMIVGDGRARQIFLGASAIADDHKEFILLRSDRKADPPLVADHAAATGGLGWLDNGEGPFRALQMDLATVDRLDTAVLWKAVDLAIEAGFNGKKLDDLTMRGARFQFLGQRGDGLPIRPPLVDDDLARIPRVVPAHGLRLVQWPSTFFEPLSRPERSLGIDPVEVLPAVAAAGGGTELVAPDPEATPGPVTP